MLIGLEVSSLACKCAFYRLNHKAKEGLKYFEGLEIQK